MNVAAAVGRRLASLGAGQVFGLVGSGNFHLTNALVAGGARFVAAAHEAGAATMADAYARVSGRVGVLSVHQGPGVTNALTGITEAAKSRTPMVVLAPEVTNPRSNFHLDLAGAATAVGAHYLRVRVERPLADTDAAWARAAGGATVVLGLPLEVQAGPAPDERAADPPAVAAPVPAQPPAAPADAVKTLADALRSSRRPVFIAGRGAARQPCEPVRDALVRLAERCGALLAVSAAARGLFAGDPWYLDVSGGFATPLAASLIGSADLVVAWGSTLNMWTTRHGRLIPPDAVVAQVDLVPEIPGAAVRVPGDVQQVASAVLDALAGWSQTGWRSEDVRTRIALAGRWRDVPFEPAGSDGAVDPRAVTIALDDLLPADRTVAVDSGNFMGYPSMFLSVPDAAGFCFTQAFQSVGLGLASAIGAAVARPDRLTVAALGDGGFLMSVAELSTAVRLGLPMVVLVYNDAAYGAEVHHFGPDGHPLDTVLFPDTDLAAIGRGFGCTALTVRSVADLAPVRDWLRGSPDAPLLIDAKVRTAHGSWWLEEAFRGH